MVNSTAIAVATSCSVVSNAVSKACTSTEQTRMQLTAVAPAGLRCAPTLQGPSQWARRTVSNGSRVHAFNVWNPNNNQKYETLSYLPPLTDEQIVKQIDYLLLNKWIPAIEFESTNPVVSRTNFQGSGYYDGRYWTLWRLPLFGATDSDQVAREVIEARTAYPDAFIRVIGFDNVRQVQCISFIVSKPQEKGAPKSPQV